MDFPPQLRVLSKNLVKNQRTAPIYAGFSSPLKSGKNSSEKLKFLHERNERNKSYARNNKISVSRTAIINSNLSICFASCCSGKTTNPSLKSTDKKYLKLSVDPLPVLS